MNRQTVTFAGADGQQLSGRLIRPLTGTPRAYALFAHCFTCTKNLAATRNIAGAMADEGIATLVFDFTGLGSSEGDFADTNFSTNVSDLVAAARFLEQEFDAPRILVGHSLGGTAILMAAADIPSASAVATIGSPAEASHVAHLVEGERATIETQGEAVVKLAGRPFRIKKQFLDDLERHSVLDSAAVLRKALLVMHAPLDDLVEVDNASRIFVVAKHPKSFISLDKADHLLSKREDSDYAGRVIATWASHYLDAVEGPPQLPAAAEGVAVALTRIDGFETHINVGGHGLVADEPVAVGGTNTGPSPYGLLSAALAACTTMTLKMYAARKKLPVTSITAGVRHSKIHAKDCEDCESSGDARVDVLDKTLEIEGDITDEQRERMGEIASRCPVHRTLLGEIKIKTELAGQKKSETA